MKQFLIALTLSIILIIPISALSQEPVNRTFQWEQSDYDKVNYWILYWGLTSGGPYGVDYKRIDKTILAESQEAPVVIHYPANAKTKYYFVLMAFWDAEHHSGFSNEVSLEMDFIYTPQDPLQLRVIITPQ